MGLQMSPLAWVTVALLVLSASGASLATNATGDSHRVTAAAASSTPRHSPSSSVPSSSIPTSAPLPDSRTTFSSADKAGTSRRRMTLDASCNSKKLAVLLVNSCEEDEQTHDCCNAVMATVGRGMACFCSVTAQPFYRMSSVAGGNDIVRMFRECGGDPCIAAQLDEDCGEDAGAGADITRRTPAQRGGSPAAVSDMDAPSTPSLPVPRPHFQWYWLPWALIVFLAVCLIVVLCAMTMMLSGIPVLNTILQRNAPQRHYVTPTPVSSSGSSRPLQTMPMLLRRRWSSGSEGRSGTPLLPIVQNHSSPLVLSRSSSDRGTRDSH